MPRRALSLSLILLFMLLSVLACQTVTAPLLGVSASSTPPPAIVSRLPNTLLPAETQVLLPSDTPQPTATPRPTLQPKNTDTTTPTATTAAATEVQPTPLPLTLQLEIFESLWDTINEEYLYPDFNGQDWNAVYAEFKPRIESGLSNQEFYQAMSEMVARLGDDHSVFLTPAEVTAEDEEYAGNVNYVGIGVLINALPEKSAAGVVVVFPGSPAEQAGLQPRDTILLVDGQSILDENGYLKDIVRGPEGSQVTITVQTPGSDPRQLTITRRAISGSIPVHYTLLASPQGLRIGYIFLVSFTDSTIDEQVADALRAMTADAPLDGLIIDNRENFGGADTVMRPILSYFASGVVGSFISRNEQRPLEVKGEDINGSQALPLVVLVGKNTVSYGEIFSGILKDSGRAYLIGEASEGNVETLWGYNFDDGSRAWIAHESFRPANHPEENWEELGIVPDLALPASIYDYSLETDPAVLAALEHFDLN